MVIIRQKIYGSIPKPPKPEVLASPVKPISKMPSPDQPHGLIGKTNHIQQAKIQGDIRTAVNQQQSAIEKQKTALINSKMQADKQIMSLRQKSIQQQFIGKGL